LVSLPPSPFSISKSKSENGLPSVPSKVPNIPKPGKQNPAVPAPSPGLPPVSNPYWAHRWGWYLFALFIPLAGILTGLLFYDQESTEARKVGKNALWIGFLVWVVLPILAMMALLFLGSLVLASWLSGVMSPVD
jgi:hypothetical protein